MTKKRLLICPNCYEKTKRKEVLGEIDEAGNLVILRYGSDKRRATMVVSPVMVVVCGTCSEVVFYRKSN